MQQFNMSWIEVQFLKKAVDCLCQCRQTLMYTYVFAFYLQRNNQSIIFRGLSAWICGCMAGWICGCMAEWICLYGWLDLCLYGWLDLCSYGCRARWIYACWYIITIASWVSTSDVTTSQSSSKFVQTRWKSGDRQSCQNMHSVLSLV